MHCKSLWIKASAKCINVNVNVFIIVFLYFGHAIDTCIHYILQVSAGMTKIMTFVSKLKPSVSDSSIKAGEGFFAIYPWTNARRITSSQGWMRSSAATVASWPCFRYRTTTWPCTADTCLLCGLPSGQERFWDCDHSGAEESSNEEIVLQQMVRLFFLRN